MRLFWEPTRKPKGNALPYALKVALGKRFYFERQTLSGDAVGYLEELRDAGIDGAQQLLDAIEKHKSVDVWLE